MVKASDKRIDEALRLLEEVAKDQKDELKQKVNSRYSRIQHLFDDKTSRLQEHRDKALAMLRENEEKLEEAFLQGKKALQEKFERSRRITQERIKAADEELHRNPLPYLGGAAVGALLMGFLLGSRRK